jgi:uncharacterized protein (DUF885 family)
MRRRLGPSLTALLLVVASLQACSNSSAPQAPAAGSGDAAFRQLASEILEYTYKTDPTTATGLGIHKYDDMIPDLSAASFKADTDATKPFRSRLDNVDAQALSSEAELDLEFLKHKLDARVLKNDVIRGWTKDPDIYSSGITSDTFVMISRDFAPPEQRLKSLTSRLKLMPNVLAQARKNLDNPPKVYTEIAIEQIDGNRSFFESDVPAAFADVKDAALVADFKRADDAVVAALGDYKNWLESNLLPRSTGSFALGADTYAKLLDASEMITTPLPDLLSVAEADLKRNQQALADAARQIDPTKTPEQVLADAKKDFPPASQLLGVVQNNLDGLAQFVRDKGIIDLPPNAPPARVVETPPFLRATTSASMDIPGPFEKVATEAYFTVTLPDPTWPKEEQDALLSFWYRPQISNISVHEVWPGHYVQFLYAKDYPSDVRKVFSAASNFEGWAHYCEQMVLDEGLHAGDPSYRLAEVHLALLRDVRFIAGIKLHTQGMTVEQAQEMFAKDAYQSEPIAESEARRGTTDPLYGYYTMGKLMILKLREDYKAKMGDTYSLKDFHDAFVKLGPIPLPLVRKAMLGDVGKLFE